MPTVPTQRQQLVREEAAPNVQLRPAATASTFGAGPETGLVTQGLQGAAEAVAKIAAEEKQKADQLAVYEADGQLSATVTRLLYDPKEGAMNKRGKDAFALPDTVMDEYAKRSSEIDKGLKNPEQRASFRRMVLSRRLELDRAVQSHVGGEIKQYDNAVTESYLTNERDAAAYSYNDPDRVSLSIERQRGAILDHARRNGLPEEWVKLKVAEATSKTHSLVVTRMLTNDLDLAAKAYYQNHKTELTGADSDAVEKMIDEGTLRGESQRQTDDIVRKVSNRQEAMARAKGIKDPKVRDAVETRIDKYYSDLKQAETEARNDIYIQSANLVDQNLGKRARDVVPPDMWTKMTPEQRSALERRAEDVPNDDKRWLTFLDLPADKLATMSRAEFESDYWAHFDKEHRTRAENKWHAAVEARKSGAADPKLSTTLGFNDRIENAARLTGLVSATKSKADFSEDEAKAYAHLEQAAAREVEQFELNQLGGKRKATGEEQQKIIDGLVLKKVFVERSLWWDKERPAVVLSDDEKQDAYVPLDQIPKQEAAAIENFALSKKKRLKQRQIERAYAAYLIGDRTLFNAIVAE